MWSRVKPEIFSKGSVVSFRRVLFLWYQTDQAVAANRATEWGLLWINFSSSGKEFSEFPDLTAQPKSFSQTIFNFSQLQTECRMSSTPSEQWWQTASWRIFRFIKLSFVGKEFVHAFQMKCLIFPGTLILQMLFQKAFSTSETWCRFNSSFYHSHSS